MGVGGIKLSMVWVAHKGSVKLGRKQEVLERKWGLQYIVWDACRRDGNRLRGHAASA